MQAAPADSPAQHDAALAGQRLAKGLTAGTPPDVQPRVLVADDHPVNREVLVRQLELLGVAADTVSDGVEALAAWAQRNATPRCWPTSTCRAWTATSSRARLRAAEAQARLAAHPDRRGHRQCDEGRG